MDLMKPKEQTNNQQGSGWAKPAVVAPELKPYSPEWFLSNYLENWDNDDLRVAIENDVRPDLSTYSELILEQTTDFFMNFLRSHRPDLTNAQTKQGKDWIRRIVKSATGFR